MEEEEEMGSLLDKAAHSFLHAQYVSDGKERKMRGIDGALRNVPIRDSRSMGWVFGNFHHGNYETGTSHHWRHLCFGSSSNILGMIGFWVEDRGGILTQKFDCF